MNPFPLRAPSLPSLRQLKRLASCFCAMAAVLAASSGWAGQRPAKGGPIQPDLIYHNYCSVCHGDRGDGNSRAKTSLVPPPRDFTNSPHLTRDYILGIITNGKPGTAMVSWKTQLTGPEIAALADFMMAVFVNKTAPLPDPKGVSGTTAHGGRSADAPAAVAAAAPVAGTAPAPAPSAPAQADMSIPMPGGLKGDVAKGGKFYRENCATCHGANGDGKGPRAYFINPKPRNFVEDRSRATYNRPALYAAVSFGKVGTEMPAWKFVLSEQEIANVAEYVFRSFIQPGAVANVKK